MAYATVTLRGRYVDLVTGAPAKGAVAITPTVQVVRDPSDAVVLTGETQLVALDVDGRFSVTLPATDDPNLVPNGFGYTLQPRLSGQTLRDVTFDLPAAVPVVEADTLLDIDPATLDPAVQYVPEAVYAARVAAVDEALVAAEASLTAHAVDTTDVHGIPDTAALLAQVADLAARVEAAESGQGVLRGTGSPEGVVTAAVGAEYIDTDETFGAVKWFKASGVDATGWKVVYGDTGWRECMTLVDPAKATAELLRVRRVNNTVLMQYRGKVTVNNAQILLPANVLPVGFMRATSNGVAGIGTGQAGTHLWVDDTRNIVFANAVANNATVNRVIDDFATTDPWPTALPGTAV